jgi:hypothetical protein
MPGVSRRAFAFILWYCRPAFFKSTINDENQQSLCFLPPVRATYRIARKSGVKSRATSLKPA